jgi:hypothetical protein
MMRTFIFSSLLLVNTASAFKVCAKSGHLTNCDGSPYAWDSFPYITIHGSKGRHNCDGDPYNPFAGSYVKTDNADPVWNMCCEYSGDVTSVHVEIVDHETGKNQKLSQFDFENDGGEDFPTGEFTKELRPASLGLSEFMFGSILSLNTQVRKVVGGALEEDGVCHMGTATFYITPPAESALEASLAAKKTAVAGLFGIVAILVLVKVVVLRKSSTKAADSAAPMV